jgi:nickel superoxide dismutase
MKGSRLVVIAAALFISLTAPNAFAHCQIPCGIYDDAARFALLEEHVTTIEKAMKTLEELSAAQSPNYNQIVRWVRNKEHHADEISEIVTHYFMAQRVKPAEKKSEAAYSKYLGELTSLHEMVVYSMKAKQTTDLKNVDRLRALVRQFKASYLGA